jgi:hypothetical protein
MDALSARLGGLAWLALSGAVAGLDTVANELGPQAVIPAEEAAAAIETAARFVACIATLLV